MNDEEYGMLQWNLSRNPELGAIIKASGGVRKVRWNIEGKGKRGGARVIYYWITDDDEILFLDIYRKSDKDDLSKRDIAFFKQLVKEYLEHE